jgi:lysozyme family protein
MRKILIVYIHMLISREGGYVNDPHDSGGETKFGITVSVARNFGYLGEMIDMPRLVAEEIYADKYWFEPNLPLIEQESSKIAEEVFDSAVNCGQATAIEWLQRSLNALNRQEALFPNIVADGIMGSQTQYALRSLLRQRTLHGESVLLKALNCLQGEYYIRISEQTETNETFLFGWLRTRVT